MVERSLAPYLVRLPSRHPLRDRGSHNHREWKLYRLPRTSAVAHQGQRGNLRRRLLLRWVVHDAASGLPRLKAPALFGARFGRQRVLSAVSSKPLERAPIAANQQGGELSPPLVFSASPEPATSAP